MEEEVEAQRGGVMVGFTEEKASLGDCSFIWDEESKLYFHAGTGFYHDPNAGWYYSSRDGLYYTFENGAYVLLQCNEDKEEGSDPQCTNYVSSEHEPVQDQPCLLENTTDDETLNQHPPSEWLEETLIDLYLAGYSNSETYVDNSTLSLNREGKMNSSSELEPDQVNIAKLTDCECGIMLQQNDGTTQSPEDIQDEPESSGVIAEEGSLRDEENWLAQYGQVVRSEDALLPSFPTVELWDWEMFSETTRKHLVCRLTGRLVKRTSKPHPSMPAGGVLLKTAAICEVHLDLVRVASGKVYRLRSPSTKYLTSVSTYDSSNPTKDWGFPDLDVEKYKNPSSNVSEACGSNISNTVTCDKSSASVRLLPDTTYDQKRSTSYRDRAAERRKLHGGFGVGPGEKSVLCNRRFSEAESSSEFSDTTEAEAGDSNTPFREGSYARRILESMGWKEGEALGSSTKGILEPVQAIGNRGFAGLGWSHPQREN
ncbi:hypothetical protein J5N97_007386 [Dioscorea zingiberensis]|uniref:G-patch domain-containing protein n=1 Tax=Dioscorea zingiberensis TaxID=325984 RepID=A0A9D5DC67_9LILI|nr:hypothetical protein J5N97_007386 [Dioscorea zingiberensis]